MLKKLIDILLLFAVFLLTSCTTSTNSALVDKFDGDYVYVYDYKKINAIENAVNNSKNNVDVRWVNLPTKRITRKEYEALLIELDLK